MVKITEIYGKIFYLNPVSSLYVTKGMYIMVYLYVVLFFIFGYSFIFTLIKAIKDEVSPHLTAILFLVWASSAMIVMANIISF